MGEMFVSGLGSALVAAILLGVFWLNKPGAITQKAIRLIVAVFAFSPLVSLIAGGEARWQSALVSVLIVGVAFCCVWQRVSLHLRMAHYLECEQQQDGDELIMLLLELMLVYATVRIFVRVVSEQTLSVQIDKHVFGAVRVNTPAAVIVELLQRQCDKDLSAMPVDVTRLAHQLTINSTRHGQSVVLKSETAPED